MAEKNSAPIFDDRAQNFQDMYPDLTADMLREREQHVSVKPPTPAAFNHTYTPPFNPNVNRGETKVPATTKATYQCGCVWNLDPADVKPNCPTHSAAFSAVEHGAGSNPSEWAKSVADGDKPAENIIEAETEEVKPDGQ